jgi:hypothetical protein
MAERYLKRRTSTAVKSRYFIINKRLHRILKVNRPANLVEAWSFDEGQKVILLYSEYRAKAQKCLRTKDAANVLNVSRRTLAGVLYSGAIREPARTAPYGNMSPDAKRVHWWSLENILEAHDYMMTIHVGRPRKDGQINPNQKLPTRAEVIARMNDEVVLYTLGSDGIYDPVYEPPKF